MTATFVADRCSRPVSQTEARAAFELGANATTSGGVEAALLGGLSRFKSVRTSPDTLTGYCNKYITGSAATRDCRPSHHPERHSPRLAAPPSASPTHVNSSVEPLNLEARSRPTARFCDPRGHAPRHRLFRHVDQF